MPTVTKTIHPVKPRRESIEALVFRLGGVAGAVRRILKARARVSASEVHAALEEQHPQLKPATNQVEEILQRMVDRRQVEVKTNTTKLRLYEWSRKANAPKRPQKLKQMKLC